MTSGTSRQLHPPPGGGGKEKGHGTLRLPPDAAGIARAAEMVRAGGLVAMPTETVYGLAADATSPDAVARIYAAKGRPSFNPLIVHLPDIETARHLARFSPEAEALAASFWPGPLTLVVPPGPQHGLAPAVTAGLPTVALRVPAHPVARALIAAAGRPLAAPSANPSGRISPTTADHVLEGLSGRIEAVIDAGPCPVGIESTILAVTETGVRLLRPGGISPETIREKTGIELLGPQGKAVLAPGMLHSHYAPHAPLRLDVTAPPPGAVHVGFGPDRPGELTLSAEGDLAEAARNLFAVLRVADERAARRGAVITVAPIPRRGVGIAINDRLARAAAPREAPES